MYSELGEEVSATNVAPPSHISSPYTTEYQTDAHTLIYKEYYLEDLLVSSEDYSVETPIVSAEPPVSA